MYLNAIVFADLANTSFSIVSETETLSVNLLDSSASLTKMSEGQDQLLKLNLKQSALSALHVNEIVKLKSNSSSDMHNRQISMNQKRVVMD